MLKLRAMGTKNDLKWFKKIIERYDVFHVIRISEPLPMKGTNKYFRMYIELDRISKLKNDQISTCGQIVHKSGGKKPESIGSIKKTTYNYCCYSKIIF